MCLWVVRFKWFDSGSNKFPSVGDRCELPGILGPRVLGYGWLHEVVDWNAFGGGGVLLRVCVALMDTFMNANVRCF